MSSVSVPPQTARLLRDRTGVQRVTNIELFFDLVYVFAVTRGFILIALGESIVIIGATLTEKQVSASDVTAFVVGFIGAVALWWLYFDQSAEAAAEQIARSDDPGRLGRSAYHLIHPVMVAGVVVAVAATDRLPGLHPPLIPHGLRPSPQQE